MLAGHAATYFDLDRPSPYMLILADVAKEQRCPAPDGTGRTGLESLRQKRSTIPDPAFHRLLTSFHHETGCPVLVNTSVNVRGEPIVNTPAEAYTCFMRTGIDFLALGSFLLDKTAQPEWTETVSWRESIPLD